MVTYTPRDQWPSLSDLAEFVEVDESLEEPTSPEEEEMAPVDPEAVEPPTERHVAFVKRLYALVV